MLVGESERIVCVGELVGECWYENVGGRASGRVLMDECWWECELEGVGGMCRDSL